MQEIIVTNLSIGLKILSGTAKFAPDLFDCLKLNNFYYLPKVVWAGDHCGAFSWVVQFVLKLSRALGQRQLLPGENENRVASAALK